MGKLATGKDDFSKVMAISLPSRIYLVSSYLLASSHRLHNAPYGFVYIGSFPAITEMIMARQLPLNGCYVLKR
jgi:hypothetical protein